MKRILLLNIAFLCCFSVLYAQDKKVHTNVYVIIDNDTLPVMNLHAVHIFAPMKFKSQKQRLQYSKLVRDVRIAYPYAKMVASSIIETYEYMETLPNEKARQKHLEEVQKYMIDTYKPKMKKMTRTQGKILIKLIDRECNAPSYNIVKALVGSFKAGVYNVFAGMFGNSLKTEYDPEGKDRDIEDIVIQYNEGTLDYYYSTGAFY